MRSHLLSVALFAVTLFLASAAFALTVDNETGLNTDGTAKFADPDDTMPGFMTPPAGAPSTPQAQPSVTLPMSSPNGGGPSFSFSGGSPGQSSQGDAFDRAYAHFGN
jgi:hypothetical protein